MAGNPPQTDTAGLEPGATPERAAAAGADPPRALSALWYRLVGQEWSTLAVVAPGNGPGAWRVAQGLVKIADHGTRPPRTVSVIEASLERLATVAETISADGGPEATERPRWILAVDSPLENPATIGLLSTCDAVLLLLERRRTRIPDGQRILELVGPDRFIGAVLYSG